MDKHKYIAINIGPIVDTLSMVSRPRHLWSASYLFSHLMGIIIGEATKSSYKLSLVSPAKLSSSDMVISGAVVGLYPDRAFFECKAGCDSQTSIKGIIDESYKQLVSHLKVYSLKEYINIMGVECEAETESIAISELNKKLDVLELAVRIQPHSIKDILTLITPSNGWRGTSPLFKIALDCNSNFDIKTIEEIAQAQVLEPVYSHHNYFCVVQADGDCMGAVIKNLKDGELKKLSEKLIEFGKAASNLVEKAGGIPIYAGGDDLLFIAPIITASGDTIFDLINSIDKKYEAVQECAKNLQKEGAKEVTSMSYGVAMSYYKYPLYEVLATARHLLFDVAKNFAGKNSVAIDLRKHSGSNLQLTMSKDDIATATAQNGKKDSDFISLCKVDQNETMVSAVAHKLRAYHSLFMSLNGDTKRVDAFFDKFMSMDDKGDADNNYIAKVKAMLCNIYADVTARCDAKVKAGKMDKSQLNTEISNQVAESIYATLRIAKFIKGEEIKDE